MAKPAGKRNERKGPPIRILAWGDSPAVATGFATVTRNIFTRIIKNPRFSVDFIGINDAGGWKDPKIYGDRLRIYPAIGIGSPEVFGRPRLLNSLLMKDVDIKPPWDLIFTLNDPFVLEEKNAQWNAGTMFTLTSVLKGFRKKFPPAWWGRVISYWPIDSALKENWYRDAIALPDQSVAYTQYGKQEIENIEKQIGKSLLKRPLEIIYHGVDNEIFRPMSKEVVAEFRKNFFQGRVKDDTFLCSIVARNQPRKDLPRAMKVFREFQKRRPNSFLYIHAKNQDAGGTLSEFGKMIGLKETEDFGYPSQFSENKGYPVETLNMLYNTTDALISTTLGEGFGLPYLEAMATKTINIAPDNTTVPELFNITKGDDVKKLDDPAYLKKIRGISVKSGNNDTEWFSLGSVDKERFRPLTNVDDMVAKLIWAYDNPAKVKQIEEQAYDWVQGYNWDIIAKQWESLFLKMFDELQTARMAWVPPKGYVEGDLPQSVKIRVGEKDDNVETPYIKKD